MARQLKIQGQVDIEVSISPTGSVEDVKILTGNPTADRSGGQRREALAFSAVYVEWQACPCRRGHRFLIQALGFAFHKGGKMKNCKHTKADHPAGSWRSDKIPAAPYFFNRTRGYPRLHHHSAFTAVLLRASWRVAVRRRLADLDLRDMPTGLRPDHREPIRPRGTTAVADRKPDGYIDRVSDTVSGDRRSG